MPPLTFGARRAEPAPGSAAAVSVASAVVIRGDGARAAEVGVRVVDAGVDDGDLDALAGRPVSPSQTAGAPIERHAVDVVRRHGLTRMHRDDARNRRERLGLVRPRSAP